VLTLNLFDSNFGDWPGSTAHQLPSLVQYVPRRDQWGGLTLFTDEWMMNPAVEQVQSRLKVGWLREPRCLHPDTYARQWERRHLFDFTLTYDSKLLAADPVRYRFCPYGGIWIDRRDWSIPPKTRDVSLLVGVKLTTTGHQNRRIAALAHGDVVDLFGIMGTPVGYGPATKKATLADYRFSIITETCREPGLFTAWLLDAFVQGVVPVYWGLPDLPRFFNPDGVLAWADLDELAAIVPTLTAEHYETMWRAVADNYERAQEYTCTDDWLAMNVWAEMEL
jgi:hypothetical protein